MCSKCFQIKTHHQSSSRLDTPKGGVWLALKQRESSQSFQKEPESSLNHHSINIAKFYQHHQVLSTSPSSINITTIWRQNATIWGWALTQFEGLEITPRLGLLVYMSSEKWSMSRAAKAGKNWNMIPIKCHYRKCLISIIWIMWSIQWSNLRLGSAPV